MSAFKIIGGIVVPVIFALLLNEVAHNAIKRTFQTLVYIPNFLSWVIMAGIMLDILSSDGIVNTFLGVLGMEPISFLGEPSLFPWTMILSDIWKGFGFGTVVYLAALTSIDPGIYEAAVIDGAKRWKQTIYITLPLLMPTIVLMTVLSLGNVLNAGFDQIYNLYSLSSIRPAILSTLMFTVLEFSRHNIPSVQPSDYSSPSSPACWLPCRISLPTR